MIDLMRQQWYYIYNLNLIITNVLQTEKNMIDSLKKFIDNSQTAYQAVQTLKNRLLGDGYVMLNEGDEFKIEQGKKYFVVRDGSSLIAFKVGNIDNYYYKIIASHTDSPALKIKFDGENVNLDCRKLETEVYGGLPRDLSLVQVLRAGLAALVVEQIVVEARRVAVEFQKSRAQAAALTLFLLRDGHIRALGEKADRVGEGQVLLLHDEVDDAAALFAAEAVIDLLVRRDGERAGLFVVKGAETEVVRALFGERHIAAHHVDDVAARDQLVQKALWERHDPPPFPRW